MPAADDSGVVLAPFLSFFGSKRRAARHYPPPRYGLIVEPFAGGAGYAIHYHWLQVRLYDIDPIICGVWDYLIRASQAEILALPAAVSHVDDWNLPQEAKWLIGFWLNMAVAYPRKSASAWAKDARWASTRPARQWGPFIRDRLARQVPYIRHWTIANRSFQAVENRRATWFIDPPYSGKPGRNYRYRIDDYGTLADWCRAREGQVMVCEKEGADWLPFEFLGAFKSQSGPKGRVHSREALWTCDNLPATASLA